MVGVAKWLEGEVMDHFVSIVRKQRWAHTRDQLAFSFLFGPRQIQLLNSIAHIQGYRHTGDIFPWELQPNQLTTTIRHYTQLSCVYYLSCGILSAVVHSVPCLIFHIP